MWGLIARRLAWALLTLWVLSILVFVATEILPGDAAGAILGKNRTPESYAAMRQLLDLDQPAIQRYFDWLTGMLHGDLGVSLASGGARVPVTELIGPRIENTLILSFVASAVLFPLATVLGVTAARKPGGSVDTLITNATLGLQSLPEFITAIVLILLFAITFTIFPAVSFVEPGMPLGDWIKILALPVATLVLAAVGPTARMIRGSMMDVLERDHIRMARLKGVPERRVVYRHALRNALVPAMQVVAFTVAWLVGGVLVVEFVFAYPGVGEGFVNAVTGRDIPVVQALAFFAAGIYLLVNLAADIGAILLTPKLRSSK
jgi:peptide/nickel transport system permease protein